jgi:hypothetical protein
LDIFLIKCSGNLINSCADAVGRCAETNWLENHRFADVLKIRVFKWGFPVEGKGYKNVINLSD